MEWIFADSSSRTSIHDKRRQGAEIVYGINLQQPEEFFSAPNQNDTSTSNYESHLR